MIGPSSAPFNEHTTKFKHNPVSLNQMITSSCSFIKHEKPDLVLGDNCVRFTLLGPNRESLEEMSPIR
jgi:hypothetical protein